MRKLKNLCDDISRVDYFKGKYGDDRVIWPSYYAFVDQKSLLEYWETFKYKHGQENILIEKSENNDTNVVEFKVIVGDYDWLWRLAKEDITDIDLLENLFKENYAEKAIV